MSDNERELLNLIHAYDNPEKALAIAMELLITFLDEREVPQDTSSAPHRVIA